MEVETIKTKHKKCPKCSSLNTVKISYGYPSHKTMQLAGKKKVKLGGCVIIQGISPKFFCNDCEHKWGKVEPFM